MNLLLAHPPVGLLTKLRHEVLGFQSQLFSAAIHVRHLGRRITYAQIGSLLAKRLQVVIGNPFGKLPRVYVSLRFLDGLMPECQR